MAAPGKTSKKTQASSLANCHLQVLGTGGGELKPCLFLFTDTKRYMFNCVENVQRFSNEYRVRQSKLQHLFITRMTWDNVGGLPGLSLYFANFFDALKSQLQLHGPESLSDFVHCSRFHVSPDKFRLEVGTLFGTVGGYRLPVYCDENLTVHSLNLRAASSCRPPSPMSSSTSGSEDDTAPSAQDRPPESKRPKLSRDPPSTSVFLCKLSDVPGKFNPQRAAELGLRRGPQYGALVRGESVTTPSDRVIHPSDVLGPTRIGPSFVVLECPHEGYVASVTSHPLLQKEAFDGSGQSLALIVHMTPRAVLEDEDYCRWMASFGPETKHMFLHETVCPRDWTLRGILKAHAPLNLMQPSLFRMFSDLPPPRESPESLKIFRFLPPECVVIGRSLLRYHLKPSQKLGVDESHTLQPFDSYYRELMSSISSNPDIRKALGKVPKSTERENSPEVVKAQRDTSPVASGASNVSVTFLGTGASCPSKYRNVSGILLQTQASGSVLFDCGEGTLAQLYRHFGWEEGDRILAGLGKIFISHIHGDHNLGVVSILHRRAEILRGEAASNGAPPPPTYVLGPRKVSWWLNEYSRTCQKLYYRFVDCNTFTEGENTLGRDQTLAFQTVPVIHCKESYGVVVGHGRDWKVVYSGDTRPCPELVKVGANATLLIHEATLEDNMLEDAKEKKHCTISEALQIAEQMNPEFTILTHFSQRYCRILPLILSKKPKLQSGVFTAFDHMTVSLSDMHRLPALLPAVHDVLACTNDEDDVFVSLRW